MNRINDNIVTLMMDVYNHFIEHRGLNEQKIRTCLYRSYPSVINEERIYMSAQQPADIPKQILIRREKVFNLNVRVGSNWMSHGTSILDNRDDL